MLIITKKSLGIATQLLIVTVVSIVLFYAVIGATFMYMTKYDHSKSPVCEEDRNG